MTSTPTTTPTSTPTSTPAETAHRHLYRNGIALSANTVLTSGLGWLFWVFLAHHAPQATVGAASATISVLVGLSTVAQLGFGGLLVVFLPRSGASAAHLVGRVFACGTLTSVVLGGGYVAVAGLIAPDLAFRTPVEALGFVAAVAVWSLFALQDNAFTGLRKAGWVPVENTVYGAAKLAALTVVGSLSVGSVMAIWAIPAALLILPMSGMLFARLLPQYMARHEGPADFAGWRGYLTRDSVSGLLGQLNTSALPVLAVAALGAGNGAVFGIAWLLAQALDLLSVNMGMSLVVEGGYTREHLRRMHQSMRRRVVPLVGLAALAGAAASPVLLGVFGKAYADDGPAVLGVLLLGVAVRSVTVLEISVARGRRDATTVLVLQLLGVLIVPPAAGLLAPVAGALGIAIAYAAGQIVVAGYAITRSAGRMTTS